MKHIKYLLRGIGILATGFIAMALGLFVLYELVMWMHSWNWIFVFKAFCVVMFFAIAYTEGYEYYKKR